MNVRAFAAAAIVTAVIANEVIAAARFFREPELADETAGDWPFVPRDFHSANVNDGAQHSHG